MNEKAARLARQVNRLGNILEKKRIPLDGFEQVARDAALKAAQENKTPLPPEAAYKGHRIRRDLKTWWDSQSHRTRGIASGHWKHAVKTGSLEG